MNMFMEPVQNHRNVNMEPVQNHRNVNMEPVQNHTNMNMFMELMLSSSWCDYFLKDPCSDGPMF